MIDDEDVILIMNQIDRIQREHFPNMDSGGISVAEAYRLALLQEIAERLKGIDDSLLLID